MSRPIKDFILESLEDAMQKYRKNAGFFTKYKDSRENKFHSLYLESSLHDRLREQEGVTSPVITEPRTLPWLSHSFLFRESTGGKNIEDMDLTIIIHGSYKRRYKLAKG